jgi:hypothetical protein
VLTSREVRLAIDFSKPNQETDRKKRSMAY